MQIEIQIEIERGGGGIGVASGGARRDGYSAAPPAC
jgi:hypothetical protein